MWLTFRPHVFAWLCLLVCALCMGAASAGFRYEVNGNCDFLSAVANVNAGQQDLPCDTAIPIDESFDEITFSPAVSVVNLTTTVEIEKSVRIRALDSKVSFVRQPGHDTVLFLLTSPNNTMSAEFDNCVFTQDDPSIVVTIEVFPSIRAGHIYAEGLSRLELRGCDFSNSHVETTEANSLVIGSVAALRTHTVVVENCSFTGSRCNSISSVAGALVVQGAQAITLDGCDFNDNVAVQASTAFTCFFVCNGPVDANSCRFISNNGSVAMAVRMDSDDSLLTVDISDSYFADNDGGLSVLDANYLNVSCSAASYQCGFESNVGAGAVEFRTRSPAGEVVFTAAEGSSAVLSNNIAPSGGAVKATSSQVTLSGPWNVRNNEANGDPEQEEGDGGAFSVSSFHSVGPVIFEGNSATNRGGAVFATLEVTMTDASQFLHNSAEGGGGVAFSAEREVILQVIGPVRNNTANSGGVISNGSQSLASLTVVGFPDMMGDISQNNATSLGSVGGVIESNGDAFLSACMDCAGLDIFENEADFAGAVVSAVGKVTMELGPNVDVFNNRLRHPECVGAVAAGANVDLTGGQNFRANGVDCSLGGAIWAEQVACISGEFLVFTDHATLDCGGAVYADEIIATLKGVDNNVSPLGGAMCAAASIVINNIEFITNNSADRGGAFYSEMVTISDIKGLVDGNKANQIFVDVTLGSVSYSSVGEGRLAASASAVISNNVGSIAYSEGTLTVDLNSGTEVSSNESLFFAKMTVIVNARGASFSGNTGQRGIHSIDRSAELNNPGPITSNIMGDTFISAAERAVITGANGDITDNSADAFMRGLSVSLRADPDAVLVIGRNSGDLFFRSSENIQVTGASQGALHFEENNCITFFSSAMYPIIECQLSSISNIIGNSSPFIFAPQALNATITITANRIADTVTGSAGHGFISVKENPSITLEALGGICGNFAGEEATMTANGFLVSRVGGNPFVSAEIEVRNGENMSPLNTGSIENNISTIPPFVIDFSCGSSCSNVSTILYSDTQLPLPSDFITTVLEEPTSLEVIDAPEEIQQGAQFTVTLELLEFARGSVAVGVKSDSANNPMQGTMVTAMLSTVFFSELSILGPPGVIELTFFVVGVCNPIEAVHTIELIGPSPTATPTAMATPSNSAPPTSAQSFSSTPTSSMSRTPSVSKSSTRTISKSPSNSLQLSSTPSRSQPLSASSTPSAPPSFSSTPVPSRLPSVALALPPLASPPPSIPSRTPSPTSTRSRTRTQFSLVIPSCQQNCIAPEAVPLDRSLGDERVPIANERGELVGSVTLPASAVQPGETVIVGPASREAEAAAQQLDLASSVVAIVIVDNEGFTTQPTGDLEVCLEVEDADRAGEEGCLSFFDEDTQEWLCEDPCLEIDGDTACGTVDHLTNFAVLLTGGGGGHNGCDGDDDDGNFIFDEAWKDGVFVGSFALAAIAICVLVAIIVIVFPGAIDRCHGSEYRRIKSLRTTSAGSPSAISSV